MRSGIYVMTAAVLCVGILAASRAAVNRITEYAGRDRMKLTDNGNGPGAAKAVLAPADSDAGTVKDKRQGQEVKKVALTFDDGPDPEYTPALLDGLKERGVKATFFVIGKEAETHPELMERIVSEGHLIGNHTYSHVDLKTVTDTAAAEEIARANAVIKKYTGEDPCFIRPPFGSWRDSLADALEMIPVLWTIDTMDWARQDESCICTTVYREVEDNSIILMHDEYPTTVRAALSVVDCLLEKGYTFVTVDEIVLD